MKIFHEAPLSIFTDMQHKTDGDYALVHLFSENEEYLRKFEQAKMAGREIILDNSIFELGEAFDDATFAHWARFLQPDWYIVPDSLENKQKTLTQFDQFMTQFNDLPGKPIGVLQGKNDQELLECYSYLAPRVAKIAISFDYAHWGKMFPEEATCWHAYMKGRQHFVDVLRRSDGFCPDLPIHLLGCALPQEFKKYHGPEYAFIDSVDTSNPVVHGLHRTWYGADGLDDKETKKLCELINAEVDPEQWLAIMHNMKEFRRYCNG